MSEDWQLEPVKRGGPLSHVLVFDDIVAHEREDLVAEAIEFLGAYPGVIAVDHVDREAVELSAHAVPTSQLTDAMQRFWEAATQQKRPWMTAVDQAVVRVSELTAAYGYRRLGWELTRVLDDEVTHAITLDHRFGRSLNEHTLDARVTIRFALPDVYPFEVARYSGPLEADAELTEAITGRVLPALDGLSTVDAMLERWQNERSVAEDGRWPYGIPESRLHARLLVSRGRISEARQLYQQDFERCQPRQRPHLLELVAGLGVPAPTTGTNPHLSVAQEATLAAWQANVPAMVDQLRGVTGLRLDGSTRSLDQLWAWLRNSPDRLQATLADAAPALDPSFYGVLTSIDITYGRRPAAPWLLVTVELVTAYLGQVVMGRTRGTSWGIDGSGELAMARRGGTGLLSRVFTMAYNAFNTPAGTSRPDELRRLADDMVRWVNEKRYPGWVVRLGVPGP